MLDRGHERDGSGPQARVEQERAALAASIDALRERLTVDGLMAEAGDSLRRHARPVVTAIDRTVRANPLAVALTVAGVAWLVLGPRGEHRKDAARGGALAGTRHEAMSRWADEGGALPPEPEQADPPDDDWLHKADTAERRARDALAVLDRAAARALAPAADLARDRAAVLAHRSAELAHAFHHGLDAWSEAARGRIIAAREAAFAARDIPAAASRAMHDNPILASALGLALGAALGALLPVSATERKVLAGPRARLLEEARRIMEEERARAEAVAQGLAEGLRDDLSTATDRIKGAAETVVKPGA